MEEDPKIEQPSEVPNDAEALMAELKKLDIESPTDIQNMAVASAEAGKAWNQVGELRKENARLTELAQAAQPVPEYNPEYGETLDLGKVVKKEVEGVLYNYLQGQRQAQLQTTQILAEVKNDPDYGIVGGVFEKYINTPEAIMKLQTGQTDYKTEWSNTKTAYYRNLAKRSSATLEGLMSKGVKPPHVEQGTTEAAPTPEQSTEKAEEFKNIKKAQKEGNVDSNAALERIIKNVMPDAEVDPSFFMP